VALEGIFFPLEADLWLWKANSASTYMYIHIHTYRLINLYNIFFAETNANLPEFLDPPPFHHEKT